jgi:hypothetical protein
VDSGNKVLTVRERLEYETPVILMDAKSAADGAKLIEQEIGKVQKWLDTTANSDQDPVLIFLNAVDYLYKHPFLGGISATSTDGAYLQTDGTVSDEKIIRMGKPQGLPPRGLPSYEDKQVDDWLSNWFLSLNVIRSGVELEGIERPTGPTREAESALPHGSEVLTETKIALAKIEPKITYAKAV